MLGGFFLLPELRKLEIEDLNFRSENPDEEGCLVYEALTPLLLRSTATSSFRRSPLEDLRFIDCEDERSGHNFEGIIAYTEALKRFVFVTYKYICSESPLGGIAKGLIRHMAHLEEIVISPSDGTHGGYLNREWYFNHCFTNLRRVALPKCLLTQDIGRRSQCLLPRRVEEVQIQFTLSTEDCAKLEPNDSARKSSVAAVEWLLKAKSENLTQLKRVIWWYQPTGLEAPKFCTITNWNNCYGSLPELQRLSRQFADAGVRFEWTLVGLFRCTPFGRRLS